MDDDKTYIDNVRIITNEGYSFVWVVIDDLTNSVVFQSYDYVVALSMQAALVIDTNKNYHLTLRFSHPKGLQL